MIIAVTGHRPKHLWGYNLKHPNYRRMFDWMYILLKEKNATHTISGMALGVDTVFAFASIRYRNNHPGKQIIFECAIPCSGQSSKWSEQDKKYYEYICKQANKVTFVSKENYDLFSMQRRNEYMVDQLVNPDDLLLAVWNGKKTGGTYNCIRYAEKVRKNIEIVNPTIFEK